MLLPRVLFDQMSVAHETSEDIGRCYLFKKILEMYLCKQ